MNLAFSYIIPAVQWFFFLYFVVVNLGYMMLNAVALSAIYKYMQRRAMEGVEKQFSRLKPPVSILIPAYNEAATISSSVRSMLQLNYSEYEVVVINDGSRDDTLAALTRDFGLVMVPEAVRRRLESKPVRGAYISRLHPNLRVIDKENGGKSDSLNAGINASRFPLFCCVDADSILEHDSLTKVVQPFLEDPHTIAAGGSVRAVNGCTVSGGHLLKSALPKNPVALFQIIEYFRGYLIGRLGWSELNSLMIISGAFGLFKKEAVIEAGGYDTKTVGEDMELVVRLHRLMREKRKKYSISFIPDPVCWTEVPEDLVTLRSQRIRWQRGLAESISLNRSLLFSRHGGMVGWFTMPFLIAFELFGSVIEVAGFFFTIIGFLLGVVSLKAFLVFIFLAIGLGVMLSVNSLLIEELSFKVYKKPSNALTLFLFAVAENFGYRQYNSWWRVVGLWRFAAGKRGGWGEMKRRGLER